MQLIVDYTKNDYIEAMRCYYAYRPMSAQAIAKGAYSRLVFLFVFGIAAGGWYVFRSTAAGLFAVAFLAFDLWANARRFWLISARPFDSNPRWREVRDWHMSDKGIEIHSRSVDTTIKWVYLSKVLECQTTFLFFHGDINDPDWFFVPKRVFESVVETNMFRAELDQHTTLTTARLNVFNYVFG